MISIEKIVAGVTTIKGLTNVDLNKYHIELGRYYTITDGEISIIAYNYGENEVWITIISNNVIRDMDIENLETAENAINMVKDLSRVIISCEK